MRSTLLITCTLFLFCLVFAAPPTHAQDSAATAAHSAFEELMSGAKLIGSFTVTGKESGELTAEEYHIISVKKMDEANLWMFQARIKYGEHDVTVPLPLPVEWAGETPVITLDDFDVPLMGRFSSRVLIDIKQKKYSGTWSHDDVGGHLFGMIEAGGAQPSAESKRPTDQ